jgi:hypothetical protein
MGGQLTRLASRLLDPEQEQYLENPMNRLATGARSPKVSPDSRQVAVMARSLTRVLLHAAPPAAATFIFIAFLPRREPHWPAPRSPRCSNNPHRFRAVEWLCQHIVGAQAQRFGPQAFVCKPRPDDEGRLIGQDGYLFEHVLPRTRRQIPLSDDNFEMTLPQRSKPGGERGAGVHSECTARVERVLQLIENVLKEESDPLPSGLSTEPGRFRSSCSRRSSSLRHPRPGLYDLEKNVGISGNYAVRA